MKLQTLTILHAEDDTNDVLLLKRALSKTGVEHRFYHVEDGEQVLQYLQAKGPFSDRDKFPFPNVLVIDLKMPKKGGLEVLQWLHAHEECGVIPTIVLTSSAQPQDIKKSYQCSANAYFTKPNNPDEWAELLNAVFAYWKLAHVPEPPPDGACR